MAFLKAAHLLVKLFILLRKNPLNYGNILFAKNIAYLAQAHAKLLHISDYIKARGLLKSVIAVAAVRVNVGGFKQPVFVIKAQSRNTYAVNFCHFSYGKQLILHKISPKTLIYI